MATTRAALGTPPRPFSTIDCARFALALAGEHDLLAAATAVETEARRVTRSDEALCVLVDWANGVAFTPRGRIDMAEVCELVRDVASRGQPRQVGDALLVPLGAAPARAVLAVRRRIPYSQDEHTALAGVVATATPVLDRLPR